MSKKYQYYYTTKSNYLIINNLSKKVKLNLKKIFFSKHIYRYIYILQGSRY